MGVLPRKTLSKVNENTYKREDGRGTAMTSHFSLTALVSAYGSSNSFEKLVLCF